jgi:hypothetical protein
MPVDVRRGEAWAGGVPLGGQVSGMQRARLIGAAAPVVDEVASEEIKANTPTMTIALGPVQLKCSVGIVPGAKMLGSNEGNPGRPNDAGTVYVFEIAIGRSYL